jgi:ubiquinone/menaquinone biosynthesis C-methylase UbiE
MNCDRIARAYRWLEYAGFGRALEQRRTAFLGEATVARRILALGDGDGRALAALVHANPDAKIDYVDLSERMLQLARQRAGADRVTYYQADALTLPLPEAEYDLIVTHFFLDCLEGAGTRDLVARVAQAAQPHARWLVSEFRDSSHWARLLVRFLYLFFRLTTGLKTRRLVDYHPYFERNGFRLARIESAWGGLLASELWTR